MIIITIVIIISSSRYNNNTSSCSLADISFVINSHSIYDKSMIYSAAIPQMYLIFVSWNTKLYLSDRWSCSIFRTTLAKTLSTDVYWCCCPLQTSIVNAWIVFVDGTEITGWKWFSSEWKYYSCKKFHIKQRHVSYQRSGLILLSMYNLIISSDAWFYLYYVLRRRKINPHQAYESFISPDKFKDLVMNSLKLKLLKSTYTEFKSQCAIRVSYKVVYEGSMHNTFFLPNPIKRRWFFNIHIRHVAIILLYKYEICSKGLIWTLHMHSSFELKVKKLLS